MKCGFLFAMEHIVECNYPAELAYAVISDVLSYQYIRYKIFS